MKKSATNSTISFNSIDNDSAITLKYSYSSSSIKQQGSYSLKKAFIPIKYWGLTAKFNLLKYIK